MTKTVSLSDEAYAALVEVRRPGESFSELARRLAKLAAQDSLFRPSDDAPAWTDNEAEDLKRRIYRARDESRAPRVGAG